MPNRLIKESLCTSDRIASLSDFEFRLWVGLITQADDAGRGDARPAIIKGSVFPLRERVTAKDIDIALHGLAAKGCISLYNVGGKSYFLFPTWAEHQRVRDCKPRFPAPNEADFCQSAADCGELPQLAADCGYNPIQSESNTNTNTTTARARAGGGGRPSVEECKAFCDENGIQADGAAFHRHFSALGWIVAGEPVKNWKALLLKWAEDHPAMVCSTTQNTDDLTATEGRSFGRREFIKAAIEKVYG